MKVAVDQPGMPRERGLRDGAEAKRLCGQHEIGDIGAAIDRAIDAERLGGVNDRDMRCAEEIVVLQRLFRVSGFIASRNAECVVELETALAAALEINTEIFARRREVTVVRRAGGGFRVNELAKPLLGLAAGDHHLPGLAVAPGRGALRYLEQMLDGFARHGLWQERAYRVALVQKL